MSNERSLRIAMLCANGIALPFLIAMTIVSVGRTRWSWYGGREVTTYCFVYIPMAATTFISVGSLRLTKPARRTFALLDMFAAIFYLALLLPIWIVEIDENGSAMALLAGYLTAL